MLRSGQAGVDRRQLLLEASGTVPRGSALGHLERQRAELGVQRLDPALELGGAIPKAGSTDPDPLGGGAQPRQQPPGGGALAVAVGKALLGRAAAQRDLAQLSLEAVPGLPGLRSNVLGGGEAVIAETQVLGDETALQAQLLALDPRPDLSRLRLALQRPQAASCLALNVERPVEVVPRGGEL